MATRRSNPSQKRRRVNNVVIFLVVFILFLVVFGLVCLWAVLKLNEEHRQQSGSNTASQGSLSTVQYTEADARNLFLVTVDGSEVDGNVMGGRTKDGNANNNSASNADGGVRPLLVDSYRAKMLCCHSRE